MDSLIKSIQLRLKALKNRLKGVKEPVDFYIKPMNLSDLSFFMSECEDGARNGHFSQELLEPDLNKTFESQIRVAIEMNASGRRSGHSILILHRKSDDKKAGFLWCCDEKDFAGRPCVEIKAVDVETSMRGNGCGALLLTVALNELRSQTLIAKCYSDSTQMSGMLKRRGFRIMAISDRGTEYLQLEPH